MDDATRISQKFLLGKGTIDDLISIRDTIEAWDTVRRLLLTEKDIEARQDKSKATEAWGCLEQLMSRISNLNRISERIALAVECEQPSQCIPVEDDEGMPSADQSREAQRPGTDVARGMNSLSLDLNWIIKPQ